MNPFLNLSIKLYLPIGTAVCLGIAISWLLSHPWVQNRSDRALHRIVPGYLGKFLFFIGVPIGVVNFIRKANLSGTIWLSPVVAWFSILLGILCAWLWLRNVREVWPIKSQGSFTLVTMVGNTSYLGFPVILLLPQLGPDYFGWAVLYDVLGTFFGAYGLGVILAAQWNRKAQNQVKNQVKNQAQHELKPLSTETDSREAMIASVSEEAVARDKLTGSLPSQVPFGQIIWEVFKSPTLFAFVLGLGLRSVVFPEWLDLGLNFVAWGVIMLALLLMGMRLQQLDSWQSLKAAFPAVGIKMFLVPLLVAMTLTSIGIEGPPRLVLILQSAMPSAFGTLVLAETYNLDRELVVTSLGLSSALLLLMLPFWLWGFATW